MVNEENLKELFGQVKGKLGLTSYDVFRNAMQTSDNREEFRKILEEKIGPFDSTTYHKALSPTSSNPVVNNLLSIPVSERQAAIERANQPTLSREEAFANNPSLGTLLPRSAQLATNDELTWPKYKAAVADVWSIPGRVIKSGVEGLASVGREGINALHGRESSPFTALGENFVEGMRNYEADPNTYKGTQLAQNIVNDPLLPAYIIGGGAIGNVGKTIKPIASSPALTRLGLGSLLGASLEGGREYLGNESSTPKDIARSAAIGGALGLGGGLVGEGLGGLSNYLKSGVIEPVVGSSSNSRIVNHYGDLTPEGERLVSEVVREAPILNPSNTMTRNAIKGVDRASNMFKEPFEGNTPMEIAESLKESWNNIPKGERFLYPVKDQFQSLLENPKNYPLTKTIGEKVSPYRLSDLKRDLIERNVANAGDIDRASLESARKSVLRNIVPTDPSVDPRLLLGDVQSFSESIDPLMARMSLEPAPAGLKSAEDLVNRDLKGLLSDLIYNPEELTTRNAFGKTSGISAGLSEEQLAKLNQAKEAYSTAKTKQKITQSIVDDIKNRDNKLLPDTRIPQYKLGSTLEKVKPITKTLASETKEMSKNNPQELLTGIDQLFKNVPANKLKGTGITAPYLDRVKDRNKPTEIRNLYNELRKLNSL